MLFITVPLSVVLLGIIVYFALSRSSSKILRLTALAALGAIILSVLICVIIILANTKFTGGDPVMPDFLAGETPPAGPQENFLILFLLAVFIVVSLGVVIFLSMRERRGRQNYSS
jgi:amino acid transporter